MGSYGPAMLRQIGAAALNDINPMTYIGEAPPIPCESFDDLLHHFRCQWRIPHFLVPPVVAGAFFLNAQALPWVAGLNRRPDYELTPLNGEQGSQQLGFPITFGSSEDVRPFSVGEIVADTCSTDATKGRTKTQVHVRCRVHDRNDRNGWMASLLDDWRL